MAARREAGEAVGQVGDRILERLAHVHVEPPRRERWVRYLPVVGLALAVAAAGFLLWVWLAYPPLALPLLLGIPTLFIAGKEAAIPVSVAAMLSAGDPSQAAFYAVLVAATMVLTDVAGTLMLFPVVHYALDSLERRKGFVGRMMRGAVRRAQRKRHLVDRYGTAGLYFFSIIPFAFNGPPIVAAVGRLAGLRAIQVVPILVAAIVTTTIAWSVFYSVGFTALHELPTWIPVALSLTIMGVMLTVAAVGAKLDRTEDAAEAAAGLPPPPVGQPAPPGPGPGGAAARKHRPRRARTAHAGPESKPGKRRKRSTAGTSRPPRGP